MTALALPVPMPQHPSHNTQTHWHGPVTVTRRSLSNCHLESTRARPRAGAASRHRFPSPLPHWQPAARDRVTVNPARVTGSLRPLRPVPARPIRVTVRPQGVRYRGHGRPTFHILTRTENPAGTVNFQIGMGKHQNFENLCFRGSS